MPATKFVLSILFILQFARLAPAQYLEVRDRYPVGPEPYCITTADFNGDGFLDIATGDRWDHVEAVHVYAGDGDGNFSLLWVGESDMVYIENIFAADLEGDQDIDIMLGGLGENVKLFFNNGDGSFGPAVNLPFYAHPFSMACADFDGDGNPDLAVASTLFAATIDLFLGNGDGTFQDGVVIVDEHNIETITTDDFDHDGDFDLAFSSQTNVMFMLNNGDGTFDTPVLLGSIWNDYPQRMRTADFNGDTYPDLLFSSYGTNFGLNGAFTSLNNGDGTFQPISHVDVWEYKIVDAIAGDFNMDGHTDVCVVPADDYLQLGRLSIVHNDGSGDFSDYPDSYAFVALEDPEYAAVACGDLDFDHDIDLAVVGDSLIIVENTSMPLEFTMTPNPAYPTVPPGGGTFTFAVTLTNNSPYNLVVRGQTEAVLPNGNTVQDYLRNGLQLNAGATLQFNTLPVQVPAIAPPGDYRYWGIITVTNPPVQVQVRDHFDFEKLSGE